jgi:polyphosphate glucokinase
VEVLVIDIGGSRVKMRVRSTANTREFSSHPALTPQTLVKQVQEATHDWNYDVISLGFPGIVGDDGPKDEPGNLGNGWVGFDFERAFTKPLRLVNDAVMQSLGAYDGDRMLFLGLGTGLGSTLITEHVIVPLELGDLPFGNGQAMADRLGRQGLEQNGLTKWIDDVHKAVGALRLAFAADYIVLGGGNATRVDPLPDHSRRGGNEDAFIGGFRLWEEVVERHDRERHRVWRVLR